MPPPKKAKVQVGRIRSLSQIRAQTARAVGVTVTSAAKAGPVAAMARQTAIKLRFMVPPAGAEMVPGTGPGAKKNRAGGPARFPCSDAAP